MPLSARARRGRHSLHLLAINRHEDLFLEMLEFARKRLREDDSRRAAARNIRRVRKDTSFGLLLNQCAWGEFFEQAPTRYFGERALSFAAASGLHKVFLELRDGGEYDAQLSAKLLQECLNQSPCVLTGSLPLHAAAATGRPETYDLLCECGGDEYVVDFDLYTPMQRALVLGNLSMVEHILLRRIEKVWTWGPVATLKLPLMGIDSAQNVPLPSKKRSISGPEFQHVFVATDAVQGRTVQITNGHRVNGYPVHWLGSAKERPPIGRTIKIVAVGHDGKLSSRGPKIPTALEVVTLKGGYSFENPHLDLDKAYRPSLLTLATVRGASEETQKVLLDTFMSGLVFRLIRKKWDNCIKYVFISVVLMQLVNVFFTTLLAAPSILYLFNNYKIWVEGREAFERGITPVILTFLSSSSIFLFESIQLLRFISDARQARRVKLEMVEQRHSRDMRRVMRARKQVESLHMTLRSLDSDPQRGAEASGATPSGSRPATPPGNRADDDQESSSSSSDNGDGGKVPIPKSCWPTTASPTDQSLGATLVPLAKPAKKRRRRQKDINQVFGETFAILG